MNMEWPERAAALAKQARELRILPMDVLGIFSRNSILLGHVYPASLFLQWSINSFLHLTPLFYLHEA